jgi:hypothetical protein
MLIVITTVLAIIATLTLPLLVLVGSLSDR